MRTEIFFKRSDPNESHYRKEIVKAGISGLKEITEWKFIVKK
jgi:hypothetical protein